MAPHRHPAATGPRTRNGLMMLAGFLLVVVSAAGSWLAVAAVDGGDDPFEPMYIDAVLSTTSEETFVVLLTDGMDHATRTLPVYVDEREAMVIFALLNKSDSPCTTTHDLLFQSIGQLGGSLREVRITEAAHGALHATIALEQSSRIARINASVGDALALALLADIPVHVDRDLLDRSAHEPLSQEDARRHAPQASAPGVAR